MRKDDRLDGEVPGESVAMTGGGADPGIDGLIVGLIGRLAEADSLEALVGPIARLRRRCVLVLDAELSVVAASATRHEAHPVERRIYEAIQQRSPDRIRTVFGHPAPASAAPIWTQATPEDGIRTGVAHPVLGAEREASWIWLIPWDEEVTDSDASIARAGAAIAAAFLNRERRFEAIEERYRAGFFERLLEGDLEVNPQVLERAKRHDFHPEARYRVAVARLEGQDRSGGGSSDARDRLHEDVLRWLTGLPGPTLATASLDQVAFLLPDGIDIDDGWDDWGAADLSVVVSRPHVGFRGVRRAYDEVAASLPHARPGHAMRYEDLLLPRVMRGDPQAHSAFVRAHVAPLRADRFGDALVETLFALAEEGFHLARTAERLDVHISTLRHRMTRIEVLTGLDLTDAQARFRVQVAHYLSHLI